ncbi:MAG: T9SS type A sorting domain-containing protein [Chitinophagales bacterium]
MHPKLLFTTYFVSILFLLFFSSILYAQKYQPMAIEGAHWIIQHDHDNTLWSPDQTFSFTIRGDSIWQGKTYKKVFVEYFRKEEMAHFPRPYEVTSSLLYALIRDEPIERKVYVIHEYSEFTNCTPHTEVVLYDFSLTKGEEFTGCSAQQFIYPFDPKPIIIDSVSVINYFDAERRVLFSEGALPIDELAIFLPLNLVEGIGIQDWGIFFLPFSSGFGISGLIDYCIGSDADCGIITAIEDMNHQNQVTIYPNLIVDSSFWVENKLNDTSLRIYDTSGRIVATHYNLSIGKQLIGVEAHWGKGVYFVQLSNKGRVVKTERVVVH